MIPTVDCIDSLSLFFALKCRARPPAAWLAGLPAGRIRSLGPQIGPWAMHGLLRTDIVSEAACMTLDGEMLDAFLPEFLTEAARLGAAAEVGVAARAIDQLRAMAAALGAPSLATAIEDGTAALDPFDAPALHAVAKELARLAARIGEPPSASAARRVLVVDDSAMMRRLVRETLALDPDFVVVGEAPDGRVALAMMRELAPDLMMLDIEMPELDGLGVLHDMALRGGALSGGDTAVVVVSSAARPGSAVAIAARRLGVAGIVAKPSGALSPDLRQRQGAVLIATARRAVGLPAEAAE